MPSYLHRKYIDLIRDSSSKYVNWDPRAEIRVGTFGLLDKETGVMRVEGNVYDPEFQHELEKHDVGIKMSDYPPQKGPVEDDIIIASKGAKRGDFNADKAANIPGIADAPIKGQWTFERRGKREAILIMHKPRQISIPPNVVLEPLYKVDKLYEKVLVTSIHVCPAYSMYLSDESAADTADNNTINLALVAKSPAPGDAESKAPAYPTTWWADTQKGVFHFGYDEAGKHTFAPLYALRRPIKRYRRHFRDSIRPEPTGDDLWYSETPPWDPLHEDGTEDPLDPEIRSINPFAHVEEEARKKGLYVP